MNREYWQEFKLNGTKVNLVLNSKTHTWEVWFESMHEEGNMREWREPDLRFTRAKGTAVVEFLQGLRNRAKE